MFILGNSEKIKKLVTKKSSYQKSFIYRYVLNIFYKMKKYILRSRSIYTLTLYSFIS